MSVIGKTFKCGNCQHDVTLSSEGSHFICPNCQTKNSLPVSPSNEKKTTFTGIFIIGLIIYGIYSLFSSPKNGDFVSSDGLYAMSVDGDDVIYAVGTGYSNFGKARYTDQSYGCEMVAALNDLWPLVAEWHQNEKVWILTNGKDVGGERITLHKK